MYEKRQKMDFSDLRYLLFSGIFLRGIGGYPPLPLNGKSYCPKTLSGSLMQGENLKPTKVPSQYKSYTTWKSISAKVLTCPENGVAELNEKDCSNRFTVIIQIVSDCQWSWAAVLVCDFNCQSSFYTLSLSKLKAKSLFMVFGISVILLV